MRVAFVHDWLDTYRGGEKVLESMLELFPDAPIYTLFYKPAGMPVTITARPVFTPPGIAWLQPLRRFLLPFLPALIESFDLRSYDLIISTSSAVAKGAIPAPHAKHICYIHSPMRYVWDQNEEYFRQLRRIPFANFLFQSMASRLRTWDVTSLPRVDHFLANSQFVRQRVQRFYGRQAEVVHPPVLTDSFRPARPDEGKGDFFLAAGAFVPYKRFDLAIEACDRLGKKLVVAGSGSELKRLRDIKGQKTEFRLNPSPEEWAMLLRQARALIFPGIEDFGIIPIEALASGTPVIAFRAGGALDYVEHGRTGVFFERQSPEVLARAITEFESLSFQPQVLAEHAKRFDKAVFVERFTKAIRVLAE